MDMKWHWWYALRIFPVLRQASRENKNNTTYGFHDTYGCTFDPQVDNERKVNANRSNPA